MRSSPNRTRRPPPLGASGAGAFGLPPGGCAPKVEACTPSGAVPARVEPPGPPGPDAPAACGPPVYGPGPYGLPAGEFGTAAVDCWAPSDIDAGSDRKSTRLNSSHVAISYADFSLHTTRG